MQHPVATTGHLRELDARPAVSASSFRAFGPLSVLLVTFALAYWRVILKLVHDWATDDNYSHGFLIIPLALYLAWERRQRLAELAPQPSVTGLLIVLASVAVLAAGTLGAELFLMRVSMIGVLAGAIVFLYGWPHLKTLAFPV